MRILALTARFPLPPLKGDKLRAWHILRHLARRHQIDLISFLPPAEQSHLKQAETVFGRIDTVPSHRRDAFRRLALSPFSPRPFQAEALTSLRMQSLIESRLSSATYDVIFVSLLRMMPNLPQSPPCPVVGDFVDSMVLNFSNRLEKQKGILRPLVAEELRRLRVYEPQVAGRCDRVTVVSAADRQAIGTPNVWVLPNGVDTEQFRPNPIIPSKPRIVFTGNLSYFPNVDAITYFARTVFPLILERCRAAQLEIAGVSPSRSVQALECLQNVTVHGFVENLPQFINSASLAICPTRCGSGMQNKMLEAMACGVPVVASSFAANGIPLASDGVHFLRADTPEDARDAIVRLLNTPSDRQAIGQAGLELVRESFSWEHAAAVMETLFAEVVRSGGANHASPEQVTAAGR